MSQPSAPAPSASPSAAGPRIGIVGCLGKVGRLLVAEVLATPGCALSGGVTRQGSPAVGRDVGEAAGLAPIGLPVGDDAEALARASDVLIDFSDPGFTEALLGLAARHRVPLVVGTTGFGDATRQAIGATGARVAVVEAPNTSPAFALLLDLIRRAAAALPDYDVELVDHVYRDLPFAPTGTARAMAGAAAEGRGVALADRLITGREGAVGPRPRGAIAIHSVRGGTGWVEHRLLICGDGEIVSLAQASTSPRLYATGAVKAALWVAGRPPGRYTMGHVFGLA